jgi:hypothetical protein
MPGVTLSDGYVVIFPADGAGGAFEAQGMGPEEVKANLSEISRRTAQLLSETVGGIKAALTSVAPSELEIEIGVKISKEGSIIIVSGKAEASLSIKATWKDLTNSHA